MVHDQLDPGLNVYLEYSNEVWNPDFSEGAYWDDVPGLDAAGHIEVEINSYEGGTHLLRNADVGNRNPGIYAFYLEMLDVLQAEGFASFQHYVATSEHYEGQGFGFNEFTGQPEETAHKWRVLRDWIEGRR